ncbi:MAG TPA: FG-GAP-like repeat-containing protein [Cryobacterium sp.]|nr:FG-GAP-like repeat-containing protein [Cryobacterium sp.]
MHFEPVAATADQTRTVLATGLSQSTGSLVDPAGRVWVSDRVAGFCRVSQPSPPAAGAIETATCLGGTLSGAGAGPTRAGAPAFFDPTAGAVGSGDELALIPDYSAGSAEVTRARWNTESRTFRFQNKLTLYDGDIRPRAVSIGADGHAYVIFQRARTVVRIIDPAKSQPGVETVAYVTNPAPVAIAAAGVTTGGWVTVYVAETTGLRSFSAPPAGHRSSVAPAASYAVGVPSALLYDPATAALYVGTAQATSAGQDVVTRVSTNTGQIESGWATGYSRIGGLGLREGKLMVADDVGLLGATNPRGTGSLYVLGESSTVRIVSGPTASDGSPAVDPAITNDSTPTFTVTAAPGSSLECALYRDGQNPVWATCSGGTFTPLAPQADGSYTFAVRQAGTGVPVTHAFTIDTVSPAAPTIGAPAEGQLVGRQILLDVLAESGTALFCAIDSAEASAYAACASGDVLTFATDGNHVLRVKAVDRAGNVSPVSQVGFLVDTAGPSLTITVPAADGATLSASPSFEFSSTSTDVSGFRCRLDTQDLAPCTSPQSYTGLAAGPHVFEVEVADQSGNRTVGTRTFSVADTTAPVVTASPAGGQYPSGQQITLTSNEPAVIYYTGDGTTPSTSSTRYTGPITLTAGFTLRFIAVDSAGNSSAPVAETYTLAAVAVQPRHDFNGDGRADVLARDAGGLLWLYPGNGSGGWLARSQVGSGWNSMTVILSPGDFNGDGRADVLARDAGGLLWLYPGDGSGGWLARSVVASGFESMTAILSPYDFNGDGRADVLARDAGGVLWLYPGTGTGALLARSAVGSGWNVMSVILSPGDFNGDGRTDVLARDANGVLWLYPGNGTGGWGGRSAVGSGWNVMTAILSPGDFNGDGRSDVLARASDGVLWMYPGNGAGGWLARKQVGSGWNGMTAIL